jgi:hypothetical protein
MNTVRIKKKLRASAIGAAAAVSLPTLLFAGAETAQAETNPTYFANQDGSLEVIYGGGGVALYATIVDAHNPRGATEVCHYHSVGYHLDRSQPVGPGDHHLPAARRDLQRQRDLLRHGQFRRLLPGRLLICHAASNTAVRCCP